jgi:hypothetical protein
MRYPQMCRFRNRYPFREITSHESMEIGEVEAEHHVVEAVGSPQVHHHEQERHDDRRDREEVGEDHQVAQLAVAVDVHGDHHRGGGGGHADQEREVGDVEPPGDLVGHPGHAHPVHELLRSRR